MMDQPLIDQGLNDKALVPGEREKTSRLLKSYEESRGTLHAFRRRGDSLLITFVTEWVVELPAEAIPYEQLKQLMGQQIALFHCDGTYHLQTTGVEGKREP